MKTKLNTTPIIAVALLLTTMANAAPVGYLEKTIPADEAIPVAPPFVQDDADAAKVFVSLSTNETLVVQKWDTIHQVYQTLWIRNGTTYADKGLTTATNVPVLPGEGVFIKSGSSDPQTISLAGAIVLDPSVSIDLIPGLTLAAYPFSSAVDQQNLMISDPNSPSAMIPPSEAFWYHNTNDVSEAWQEYRPYTDLFGSDPTITAISRTSSGVRLELQADDTITLLIKELAPDQAFVATPGWQVAASSIQPTDGLASYTDTSELVWGETADQTYTRYYLPISANTDADADGLADGLEIFVHNTSPALVDTDGDGTPDGVEAGVVNNANLADSPKTLWVDAINGNNSNDGLSEGNAKATINAATALAQAGDHIIIKAGSYPEVVTIPNGVSAEARGAVQIQF